ncbi:hypothetical protein ABZ484_20375 [Streptomyces sp. NPDC006393]|uniref:hypothetical protein n=1 Tax=Streptomyces sp. NPDC006393 TaxID=3156763 RepID=UPI0034045422
METRCDLTGSSWASLSSSVRQHGDWRQVGRFALAFTARDQKLTSSERRVELEAALKKLVAAES